MRFYDILMALYYYTYYYNILIYYVNKRIVIVLGTATIECVQDKLNFN